jgi:hypothetical protein
MGGIARGLGQTFMRSSHKRMPSCARCDDCREKSPNAPFLEPTELDAQVAPYAGFPAVAEQRMFRPMAGDNWTKWDHNSNDADVCCMTTDPAFQNTSLVIFGAGTQGAPPKPPLTKANHCANIVATASMGLPQLLARHFDPNL